MRTGISITLKPADRRRLKVVVQDRNAPHKHVWRAEIVLLSADGIGTNEVMRRTGKSKTCVWRWQERFMQEGYAASCATRRGLRASRHCGRTSPSAW
jgi:DNA invertase Pin-like site-specific DNA recombinase